MTAAKVPSWEVAMVARRALARKGRGFKMALEGRSYMSDFSRKPA